MKDALNTARLVIEYIEAAPNAELGRDSLLAFARNIEAQIENGRVMEADAVDVLIEEGWIWDGTQWQRPPASQAKPC